MSLLLGTSQNSATIEKSRYWREYFIDRHRQVESLGTARSLDYPNDKLRLQIYAHVFEALGALEGRDILDAGCGWGSCAFMLDGCGAKVTAGDIVPETIAQLAKMHSHITWKVLDMTSKMEMAALPAYDRVVVAESMQHVEFETTLQSLWEHVRPGGRLVGSIPNAECPIIQKVMETYKGYFRGASPSQIAKAAEALPDLGDFWIRGLQFRADQAFLPYDATNWTKHILGRPNRLIFALLRKG